MTQHHVFIVRGVSEEKMKESGYKKTAEDPNLEYYVHYHGYIMGLVYGRGEMAALVCRDACQVIQSGKLQNVATVTQTDDANAIPAG